MLFCARAAAADAPGGRRARCEAGHAASCAALAKSALGADDPAAAAALWQRACANGHARSCYQLGRLYERGRGVPRDLHFAAALYADACDGGDRYGCWRAGEIARRERDRSAPLSRARRKALRRLERACNALDERACDRLGELYARFRAPAER